MSLGARIEGVHLDRDLDSATTEKIQAALCAHQLVYFHDQNLTAEELVGLAQRFGRLEINPILLPMRGRPEIVRMALSGSSDFVLGRDATTFNSHFDRPSKAVLLYADPETFPPASSESVFSSMTAAWSALSASMKSILRNMTAIHSAALTYGPERISNDYYEGGSHPILSYSDSIYQETEHPLVHVHPETGETSLFINRAFTRRIVGLSDAESRLLLDFLCEHCAKPEFSLRFLWQPGSLALWDNRVVQYYSNRYLMNQKLIHYWIMIGADQKLEKLQDRNGGRVMPRHAGTMAH